LEDKSTHLNGYKIKSYGDLLAVATLLALFVGCLSWGLKLESELNSLRDDVSGLTKQVGTGILPRAEERIRNMEKEIAEIERRMQ
jgi:hypothetical protein